MDSRTILDSKGAEQLIGRGDMLFSHNNALIRLQAPFVSTEEVDRICAFIAKQAVEEAPYLLPDVETEDEQGKAVDLQDKDTLFEEAAYLVVQHQQGSISLIQRKTKIGHNRAGRIMDELEAAGIVGKAQGSKPREVLIKDVQQLEEWLKNLK